MTTLSISGRQNESQTAEHRNTAIVPEGACGPTSVSSRIVNGTEASPHGYPWMARIVHRKKQQSSFCGGTLISRRHILTAAHCVLSCDTKYEVGDYKPVCRDKQKHWAVLGDHDLSKKDGEIYMKIQRFAVHPNAHFYKDAGIFSYDYAIIVLSACVTFRKHIQPACLPTNSTNAYENATVTVLGWGDLAFRDDKSPLAGVNPKKLRSVDITVLPNRMCTSSADFSSKYLMCAADPNYWAKDSCQDDSGGKSA